MSATGDAPETMSLALPADNCSICCHETRNALATVIHLAKRVRQANPGQDSQALDAAITRLERRQHICAASP